MTPAADTPAATTPPARPLVTFLGGVAHTSTVFLWQPVHVLASGWVFLFAVSLSTVVLAPFVLFAALWAGRWWGTLERRRLRVSSGETLAAPAPLDTSKPLWQRYFIDTASWKAICHAAVVGPVFTLCCILWAGLLLSGLTFLGAPLAARLWDVPLMRPVMGTWFPSTTSIVSLYIATGVLLTLASIAFAKVIAIWDTSLGRFFLSPSQQAQIAALQQRAAELESTRTETIDSVEAERRRIERDLHDGPQQRLVSIAMNISMARDCLRDDPDAAEAILADAHDSAKASIVEMRHVARGIVPPILTDRGLSAALSALGARSPVPVVLDVRLPERPSASIESVIYFCVSEALTNVAKHANAQSILVTVLRSDDGSLIATVRDDGRGGADPTGGTGLTGLRQRVRALDGTLTLDSPTGGPTLITVTLPWTPSNTPHTSAKDATP